MRQVESFSIGGVLDATFRVFGRNIIPFMLLGLAILVPTTFLSQWAMQTFGAFSLTSIGVSMLVAVLSNTLMQASFTCAVFHTLRGDQQSLFDSLAMGARVLPFTLLASLVAGLAVWFGLLLLLIPGVLFMLMFWLAVPVAAIEREYPLKALKRSAELTKGHRGKLFGLFLLWILAGVVLGAIVGGASFAFSPDLVLNPANPFTTPSNWINWGFGVIFAVSVAVTYYDLRLLKEDMDSEAVAEVFD